MGSKTSCLQICLLCFFKISGSLSEKASLRKQCVVTLFVAFVWTHLSWINATDITERLYLPVSCWIIYENRRWKDLQIQNKCIIWQNTLSFQRGNFSSVQMSVVHTHTEMQIPYPPSTHSSHVVSQSSSIRDTTSRVMNYEHWPLTCKLSGGITCWWWRAF